MAGTSAEIVYNFCSGPAMLPPDVMRQAQSDFLNYQNVGASVMELSHRSDEFIAILASAEANLRQLMAIPDSHAVLFMQGGASVQFSAIPLNLMSTFGRAGFINTGYWSEKAMQEAARYGDVVEIAQCKPVSKTKSWTLTRIVEKRSL